jgi:hypothetical protein
MNQLPVERAHQLCPQSASLTRWLVEELWSEQAVGILGGEPKCCKSFLALDLAVSVAGGVAALRRFPVTTPGPVLLFPAEDSLGVVRQRLEGIAGAAALSLDSLAIDVITQPVLRLDNAQDRQRLANTVATLRPRLLILDPLIRLHRLDENDAGQIAALLSFLRQLQRQFQLAVLVVHHARKDAGSTRPGQALRGSSELHGWGDSNLYLRRRGEALTLSTEHRAAPSRNHIALQLTQSASALALSVLDPEDPQSAPQPHKAPSVDQRVCSALGELQGPITLKALRERCQMRTATLSSVLNELCRRGLVHRDRHGYQLQKADSARAFPLSPPIAPQGNGNRKPLPVPN